MSWIETPRPSEKWEISYPRNRRIWVDFERDEIMIDAPYCRFLGTYIRILEWYAREEVKKIRRLSIERR